MSRKPHQNIRAALSGRHFKLLAASVLCALSLFSSSAMRSQTLEKSLEQRVKFLCNVKESDGNNVSSVIISDSLYNYLQSIGVMMLTNASGDDFKMERAAGDTVSARNIVGIIPGYDPQLRSEYILLGAHYDRVIAPGANRNASAVAALQEIAQLISKNKFIFRRSVIIAFFDAGELANAGSWYFVNRSFPEVEKIRFMIDLNTLGRGGEEFPFQVFAGMPTKITNSSIAEVNQQPFYLKAEFLRGIPQSSDYASFYDKGIPVALFTTGATPFDKTHNDTPDLLDYFQLSQITEWIYSFSQFVANGASEDFDANSSVQDGNGGGGLGINGSGNIFVGKNASGGKAETTYFQSEVDKRATFMKGDERTFLRDWVYKYISYPDSALEKGTQGVVEAEFTVDKKGEVKDVKVVKSVTEALDKEVVKVIKASPKWKPASIDGKPVSVVIRVAVEFRATQEGKIGIKW